ncbi:MAG TPA: hypothetical protein VGH34_08865 [Vicinamibacterales bacterium]
MTDMMQSTGDFMKSVGKFSLAMSLLAARQVTSLVSRPKPGTPSLDEVTKAAGGQLSGAVRTAFAVGANVQSGIVDAAFHAVGMVPKGQAPAGSTSALTIPLMTSVPRRVAGVKTVASGAVDHGVLQEDLVQRLTGYQHDSLGRPVERAKAVTGLWKSEGLATSIGKHLLPENSLADPKLPREVLPIAHVGFGSGSTEEMVFDVARLNALFASTCAPDYLGFAYEGIGAILRIYERGFFKLMSGSLGLIRLDAPDGPNAANLFGDYLKQYPPDLQRLIVHGYGRLVAFSNMSIYKAIEEATTYPADRVEPAVHGAAFAFAMMNSEDMPNVLEQSAIPFERSIRAAFQNGLIYSQVFFDWYLPGLLEDWQPKGALEAELIEHARDEAAGSRKRGYPLAMRLENPRT